MVEQIILPTYVLSTRGSGDETKKQTVKIMELVFAKELDSIHSRIVVEFVNAVSQKISDPGAKVSINKVYPLEIIDEKNHKQRIHFQILSGAITFEQKPSHWMFTMQYGVDFSCANIYVEKLASNPHIREAAQSWVAKNYDTPEGSKFKDDLISAFEAGFEYKGAKAVS